jgi:hypothetical protein
VTTTGSLSPDLTADQFQVFEDGVEQPISSFALRRMPVHVVLLIDTSSSVVARTGGFQSLSLALHVASSIRRIESA